MWFCGKSPIIGDFIESYYKRKAEVKDSGNLIPGHGGMLDRMDAFMITIPAIYIFINLIVKWNYTKKVIASF